MSGKDGAGQGASSLRLHGLSPIADKRARVLVLGSFPSAISLERREPYANPRNQFWAILEQLFGIAREQSFARRSRCVIASELALWDVVGSCRREGSPSLDSSIRDPEANDFAAFYRRHPQIRALFWNGATAERYYRKLVGSEIRPADCDALEGLRLPSTSPAHAALGFDQKLESWRSVRDALERSA